MGIEFRQHIIQQQKRGVPAQISDQLKLGQLEGQHKGALLSSRAEATSRVVPEQQRDLITVGTNPAAAQPLLLSPLLPQLLLDGEAPGFLRFLLLQSAAGLVGEMQLFAACTQMALPATGDRFQTPQGPQPGSWEYAQNCTDETIRLKQGLTQAIERRKNLQQGLDEPEEYITRKAEATATAETEADAALFAYQAANPERFSDVKLLKTAAGPR